MTTQPNIRNFTYTHAVLEGTAYEVGRQQGEIIQRIPAAAKFFTSPLPERGPLSPREAEAFLKFFATYCPGLNEEIDGFAHALGASPEQVVYYAFTYQPGGHCSHFAALPSLTEDGHLLVGRNYDFNPEMSDLRLVTVRIAGRPVHTGFSEVLFGRDDGINEHGLCATMSAGAPMAPTEPGGCMFWAVIRTVLDRCATVDEAIELIQTIPISFNFNLLLADRTGQAALMEIASSRRGVKRIGPGTPDQFLVVTNHYNLPEMKPYDLGRMWNSLLRYRAVQSRLQAAAPRINCETMRGILSDPVPQGVCGYFYTEYLGTLWSEVIDVTAGTLEVCFGAASHNPWRSFDLHSPRGVTEYPVQLPDLQAPPVFWKKLAPGSEPETIEEA